MAMRSWENHSSLFSPLWIRLLTVFSVKYSYTSQGTCLTGEMVIIWDHVILRDEAVTNDLIHVAPLCGCYVAA